MSSVISFLLKRIELLIAFSIAIIGVFYFGNQHDYSAYVREWISIFHGSNPNNAYGVIFHFFAPISALNTKLPKLLFVLVYFISIYKFIEYNREEKLITRILLFNPLFWIFGVAYGSNDVLLTSLTFLAILYYIHNHQRKAGLFFSAAINFKFTPVFILPFFIFKKNKTNVQLLKTVIIYTIGFLSIGFYFWDVKLIQGFLFNVQRDSSIFSIFRFIAGDLNPLNFFHIKSLDFLSIYFVFFSWLMCFLFYLRYNLDKYLIILLAYSNVLLFYKSGHHQFYLIFLILNIVTYIRHKQSILQNKKLLNSAVLFWCWIFAFTILYPLTGQYSGEYYIREWVGFPTFILHFILNVQLFLHIRAHGRSY
jgi:hypothetical protein